MSSNPPIPESGLAEVLSTWSGRGYLWDALVVPEDIFDERKWTAADLLCRAHRVLLERVVPALARWPARLATWVDLLPAAKSHARMVRDVPFSGVSWTATRSRFGWPPDAFVGREAERSADMLIVTTLKWTLENLAIVRANAVRAYPDVDLDIRPQLDTAMTLLRTEPMVSAGGTLPGRPEIMALRSEGAPWGAVADVADELRAVESSVNELAWRLLIPDDAIRWRLFHLAVLGILLASLRDLDCSVKSLRPLGWSNGPAYKVTDSLGRSWDLWFEASGVWSYEKVPAPYTEATRGIQGAGRSLGADLLLLRPGDDALIIECKYSTNPEVVGRYGYYQATTYATEVRSRLARNVTSAVVGPEGVVAARGTTLTVAGNIQTIPPSAMPILVREFLKSVAR